MVLVERERHLDILDNALAGCRAGHGQVVMVAGAPATGKTTLIRVFTKRFGDGGVPVHMATGSLAERDQPLGVVRQLFPELPAELAASPDDESGHQQVVDLLAEESRQGGPVMVVVDDAHHADPESLVCLMYLVRRLGSLPVLVLLNESVGEYVLPPRIRVELLRQLWVTRMALVPLSSEGVRTVLDAELGVAAAQVKADEVAEISGGNPLLVDALVEDYRAMGEFAALPAASAPVFEALGHAVRTCLFAGGPATLEVAKALAVLADTASPVPVSELVALPAEAIARSMRLLGSAGLVEHGRFRHPLLCRIVLEQLDAPTRAALHVDAAQVLHDDGHEARVVAKHLVSVDLEGRPWMVEVLTAAAEAATAEREYEFALQCLQRAQDLGIGQRERAAFLARQARIQFDLNPRRARRHLGALTTASREGYLSRRDTAYLVRLLAWFGLMEQATEVLRRLDDTEGTLDEREHAEIQSTLLWLLSWFPPLIESGYLDVRGRSRAALRSSALTARPRPVGLIKPLADHGADTSVVRWAEETLSAALSERVSVQDAHCALIALLYADHEDQAERWCTRLLDQERCADETGREALLLSVRAETALRLGNLPSAVEHATAALGRTTVEGWGVAIGSPLAVLVSANGLLGDVGAATRWLAHDVVDGLYDSTFGLMYLRARGVYYLATSRPQAALSVFLQCGELAVGWKLDIPGFLPWRTDAAHAYLELDEHDRVRELVHEQFGRPGGGRRRSRAAGLRLLAAASGGRQGLALLRESIDLAGAARDRVEMVHGLVQLSKTLWEVGELDESALIARRAMSVSDSGGLMALCARLLDRAGVSLPSDQESVAEVTEMLSVLSDAERRVAALAALGSTNREISRKLCITVSTVEQHLTRVYRKLNVKRRSELSGMLPNLRPGISDCAVAVGQ
ncbi:MAG TPA: AAA family ATPase [Pseudonocardia sp.]|nr:AAA family ATPase [Pseudonocardia sp.]